MQHSNMVCLTLSAFQMNGGKSKIISLVYIVLVMVSNKLEQTFLEVNNMHERGSCELSHNFFK